MDFFARPFLPLSLRYDVRVDEVRAARLIRKGLSADGRGRRRSSVDGNGGGRSTVEVSQQEQGRAVRRNEAAVRVRRVRNRATADFFLPSFPPSAASCEAARIAAQ